MGSQAPRVWPSGGAGRPRPGLARPLCGRVRTGVRCKVRAARGDDRAGLGVNPSPQRSLRRTRLVEDRSTNPVEDFHIAAQPIGEAETEKPWRIMVASVMSGVSPIIGAARLTGASHQRRRNAMFSRSSSWCSSAHASTNRSRRRGRLLSITSSESIRTFLGGKAAGADSPWRSRPPCRRVSRSDRRSARAYGLHRSGGSAAPWAPACSGSRCC
jgi:hypothetical protein